MSQDFQMYYITTPDLQTAQNISKKLLEEKLIACANIIPQIESHYWWENQITSSKECVLLLKTQSGLFSKIEARIKELHPYEVPCIINFQINNISSNYLQWLKDSLK